MLSNPLDCSARSVELHMSAVATILFDVHCTISLHTRRTDSNQLNNSVMFAACDGLVDGGGEFAPDAGDATKAAYTVLKEH